MGVKQDYSVALEWYVKAAEGGLAPAQNAAGFLYGNGLGVGRDPAKAETWLQKAKAGEKNPLRMSVSGAGVRDVYPVDLEWYRIAAEQGYPAAQSGWGNILRHGMGVKYDYDEGYKWLRKAADQDYAEAQMVLGTYYFRTLNSPLKTWEEAEALLLRAAEQNNAEAQFWLGNDYIAGRFPRDSRKPGVDYKALGQGFMYKAAANGHSGAQCHVLEAYRPPPTPCAPIDRARAAVISSSTPFSCDA